MIIVNDSIHLKKINAEIKTRKDLTCFHYKEMITLSENDASLI